MAPQLPRQDLRRWGNSLGVRLPAAIARKVDSLNKLFEARTQLANLLSYMDGKAGAEDLIAKVLQDPALLQSLASAPKPAEPAP